MLSEHSTSIAGWVFAWTDREALLVGVSLLLGLILGAVQRSMTTDQLALDLAGIADAFERIARRPAVRALGAANRSKQGVESGIPYSMFGR
jgi:hypothetical protein